MRTNEIEKQLRQRPFVPFRLCMTDGASPEVRHPEMILTSRTVLAVATFNARAKQPEAIVFCDPVHVIRLEPLPKWQDARSTPFKETLNWAGLCLGAWISPLVAALDR